MSRPLFYGSAALLLSALSLGGGGAVAPLHNLLIQLIALVLLGIIVWQRGASVSQSGERAALILLLLIILTPLLQLVPLPFPFWSALPGREFAVQADAYLGTGGWRPLSLDPEATWLGAASLLAPVAMFLAAFRLGERDRGRLMHFFAAAALASLGLAALQVAGGDGAFRLYDGSHRVFATGFFANRNHQADLLLVAMIFASALVWRRQDLDPAVRWGLWLAAVVGFSSGIIATASRMGFLLLPLALLASASFIPGAIRRHRAVLLGGAATAAVALAFVATSAGTRQVLGRFETLSDARFEFWGDTLFLARQYFPWGSGIGTFDPVYRAIENLNRMDAPYFNHAHNDYIQILIEAGLWGALLVLFFLALFIRAWVQRAASAPWRKAAAFSILILLTHSAVDYPLRTPSLMTLFGLLCGLLWPARYHGVRHDDRQVHELDRRSDAQATSGQV